MAGRLTKYELFKPQEIQLKKNFVIFGFLIYVFVYLVVFVVSSAADHLFTLLSNNIFRIPGKLFFFDLLINKNDNNEIPPLSIFVLFNLFHDS